MVQHMERRYQALASDNREQVGIITRKARAFQAHGEDFLDPCIYLSIHLSIVCIYFVA